MTIEKFDKANEILIHIKELKNCIEICEKSKNVNIIISNNGAFGMESTQYINKKYNPVIKNLIVDLIVDLEEEFKKL